ncbi:MAG: hypothetical protein RQ826_07275 [Xanthomonadales bacterium]|nr:hypothetical protein [Xanthomonadales bacterium]
MLLKKRPDGTLDGGGNSPPYELTTIADRPAPANTDRLDEETSRARRQRRLRRMERSVHHGINGWTVRMW